MAEPEAAGARTWCQAPRGSREKAKVFDALAQMPPEKRQVLDAAVGCAPYGWLAPGAFEGWRVSTRQEESTRYRWRRV